MEEKLIDTIQIRAVEAAAAEQESNMEELQWKDIHRFFLYLTVEKQLQFITYLRSLQDIEGNSMLRPYDPETMLQSNA